MDVVPHRDPEPLKDEEKQRLLNALNDLDEPADDCAGTDPADNVLTAGASGHTDHGPLDFFNTYTGFGTFERLGNDMNWTSTPLLWNITASTERHEWHPLKMVKNRRLQRQVQSFKKSDTKQFRRSGRPPRHGFELIGRSGVCEIAEAISSCFGKTLQRFTFEMSTRELQAENNDAEELDPRQCLIVKMCKTDVELKQPAEEIRSFGRHILVRDADETHFFENDSDGISFISSVNTSGIIRLVAPKEPDLWQLIGCIGTSVVRTMDLQGNHHQTIQIQDGLCGAWTAVPVMHVGGKLHISRIDIRKRTANVVWTDEASHIADIATCWWNSYQICATTSRPHCTVKLFDVRKMDCVLEDVGLPERGELRHRPHPLHKDRRFESAWCMGKSPWMFSYCLGGYDLVFRSMGNAHGAHTSYHHDLENCGAFDSCEGCGAVRLENRAQSSLALVQHMAITGPTAVWLEHPQPHFARSPKTSSPNDPADKDSNQRKVIDSYVGSILAALPVSDTSFGGDQAALKQDIVARMLEHVEAESADCCALFPVLWGILQEEMRTSNPVADSSKAALLVLGASCELRLTLSDAQRTVEVPAKAFSSLDEYLHEQIAASCLLIPLMERREEGERTGFQLQSLDDIKTAISSRSLNPLKTAPDPAPHLVADAAMLAGMHWLEMEDLAVLHLLRRCGLVVTGFPVEEGHDLPRSGGIAQRKAKESIEEHNRLEHRRTFERELQGLSRAKLHLQRGGLSQYDEETMRRCLEKGEPLLVSFWPPAKRLRAIMALLNLADLPEGWTTSNLSEMPLGHSFTFSDLAGIATAHETGHANHRHAARTGVRLLVRALVRCGLLACSSTIPKESPQSGTECYMLNVGQSALEMNKSHGGQRIAILEEHANRLNRILSPSQKRSCQQEDLFESVQELMQHAFTLLGASPLVTWKKALAKPTLPLQRSLGRSCEDRPQRDAEGIRMDEMWHTLLHRLRREDYSKIYAWLARQEDMFHLIPGDQTLLVVEQFGRVNVAKTFCQVARMVKERLNTEDFSVELRLELLKFEGADQIARATSARTHMLRDSWDAFASKVTADAERQSKKARL